LVFDPFQLTGRFPSLTDELEEAINAGHSIPIDTSGAGPPRRRELPVSRDVMTFAGGWLATSRGRSDGLRRGSVRPDGQNRCKWTGFWPKGGCVLTLSRIARRACGRRRCRSR
jgi:hypothetical protein